jgi:NCAIR mutase (PurE)-related protein
MATRLPTLRAFVQRRQHSRALSSSSTRGGSTELSTILESVRQGSLSPSQAETMIQLNAQLLPAFDDHNRDSPEHILKSFANLDHSRSSRTGFPEVVYGDGKTAEQIARILDDMARHFNETNFDNAKGGMTESLQRVILATRVSAELFNDVKKISLRHGRLEYNHLARIVSMIPSSHEESPTGEAKFTQPTGPSKRIVVVTAGTTDLPVAEEAAVVLEAAQCNVDRICDVGVAGLHRIIKALPRLQDPDVGCVIVCAGMDGALPSVVGGLVSCPVIAVPTSIGYGVSLGGISAMLTMLNSCAPGVAVQNIDNGFGAAAFAYKCIRVASK